MALTVKRAAGISALIVVSAFAAWRWWTTPSPPSIPVTLKGGSVSIIQAGSDDAPSVAKTTPAPPLKAVVPPKALHPKDAEFDRLSAPNATPQEHGRAYELAYTCLLEAMTTARGMTASHECAISPGRWQDLETRRRILASAAKAGVPRAWDHLWEEGPAGYAAWSETGRDEWARTIEAGYKPSLDNVDSGALYFASLQQAKKGNVEQAIALAVASSSAFNRRVAVPYDIGDAKADPKVAAYRNKVSEEQFNNAATAGLKLATAAKQGEFR